MSAMTADPHAAALFRGVLADPTDDVPRLLLADRLDELNDGERAEFIRLQIQIHNCPLEERNKDIGFRQWEQLCAREQELLAKNYYDWAWPWPGARQVAVRPDTTRVMLYSPTLHVEQEFRRGFVHLVECEWDEWARHADAILEAAPLETVTLTTEPQYRFREEDGRWQFVGSDKTHWIQEVERYDHSRRSIIDMLLKMEWPQLVFDLSRVRRDPRPTARPYTAYR